MRIALASIHPRPLSGQIEGLVGLAQALESRGHQVKVISAFPDNMLLSSDRLRLAGNHVGSFLDQPYRVARIFLQLVMAAPRVDVIQLNLPTPAFGLVGDLLQALVRVPVIIGYEAHLVAGRDLLRLDRLREAPLFYLPRLLINNRIVARLSFKRAAHYLVNSRFQKDELVSLGIAPERIDYVPNMIPRDKLARGSRAGGRARLNLPEGRLLTYFGHYNHIKGVEVLIPAFERLVKRFPDLHLVLAWSGLGPNRRLNDLLDRAGLDGRVIRLGRVNVPELLSASDIAVLPYRLTIGQAALPASLLEALAANVPVVTSDLPLLRELNAEGQTALLSPPDDPVGLASAIERMLSEPNLVRQMRGAQQRWLARIHPARIVQDYEELYQRTVDAQERVLKPAGRRADV